MSKIDFELSSKVVPALLNQIIYSNKIGLRVSEIEGDAVLFFRQDSIPSEESLLEQCQYFYREFHNKTEDLKRTHDNREGAEKSLKY